MNQVLNHPDVVACNRDEEEIKKIFYSIATNFDHNNTRFFALTLQKAFSKMYDRISVNEDQIVRFKELINDGQHVVLVPTHRSYIDFLLLSYVLFAYHVKVPFVAAGEDFQNIPGINSFLRKSGAFFMKRKFDHKSNPLYVSVFKAYMQSILASHKVVEFFVEGTRSRSGKMLRNKNGLISFAMDLYDRRKVDNIHFVPVSISYEHVLEDESFFKELLGSSKTPESLGRVAKAASVFWTKYGRVDVIFGEPISLRDKVGTAAPLAQPRMQVVNEIGESIVKNLAKNLCVMPTHLIACAFALNDFKPMTLSNLVAQFEWLRDVLKEWQIRLDVPVHGTCESTVRQTLETHFKQHCCFFDNQKRVKLVGERAALCMSYYKNQIVSVLGPEAVVLVSTLGGIKGGELKDIQMNVKFVSHVVGVVLSESDVLAILDERLVPMKIMTNKNGLYRLSGDSGVIQRARLLHRLVQSQLDTAIVVAKCVAEQQGMKPAGDWAAYYNHVQKFARQRYEQGQVGDLEVCSPEAIKICLYGFVRVNVLGKDCRSLVPDFGRVVSRIEKYRHITLDGSRDDSLSFESDTTSAGLGNSRTARL